MNCTQAGRRITDSFFDSGATTWAAPRERAELLYCHMKPVKGHAMATKYGAKASEKVERAMKEKKAGTLKSGRAGKKVTSRKQAIAIGLSEARKEGGKVPPPPGRKTAKGATKKAAAKKPAARKTGSKKAATKKTVAKKTATKKTTARKTTGKKAASKKTASKRTAPKKTTRRAAAAKGGRKPTAKKATRKAARKSARKKTASR
jgi:hypothetical protein